MVLTTASSVAGDYMQMAEIGQLNKSAVAIASGDLLYLDTSDNCFKPVTTSILTAPRWAVAVKAALAADTKVLACTKGPVFILGEGVINPHRRVMNSVTTAKAVTEYSATAINATPAQADGVIAEKEFTRPVGVYLGKVSNNERDGLSLAASADGDIVLIDLNGGIS